MKRICAKGELISRAEEYVKSCKSTEGSNDGMRARQKSVERFPNIAGFARTLGVSVATLKKVESKWPELYGAMLALFEDEALNSDRSATILNTYIKERLNFGEKKEGGATLPVGDVQLVFEHDIEEDGG